MDREGWRRTELRPSGPTRPRTGLSGSGRSSLQLVRGALPHSSVLPSTQLQDDAQVDLICDCRGQRGPLPQRMGGCATRTEGGGWLVGPAPLPCHSGVADSRVRHVACLVLPGRCGHEREARHVYARAQAQETRRRSIEWCGNRLSAASSVTMVCKVAPEVNVDHETPRRLLPLCGSRKVWESDRLRTDA